MKPQSFLIGFLLLALSALGLASLPAPRAVWQVSFPTAPGTDKPTDGLPTAGQLLFSYPRWMRAGQTESLQLTLTTAGDLPGAAESWVVRVEMPGARLQPDGLQQQARLPGETSRFRWTITPLEEKLETATVWIYLQPAGETRTGQPVLVASSPFLVRIVSFLPAAGWNILRWASAAGLILGLAALGLLYKLRLS